MGRGNDFRPRFAIVKQEHAQTASVTLYGEFDLAWAQKFKELSESLCADGLRQVVLDLRGLAFIDSSGLRSIVELWERSKESGFDLTIVRGAPAVHQPFATTGLDGVLPMIVRSTPLPDPSLDLHHSPE